MICPVCMATAAATITSATSAGSGLAALVVKVFRRKNIATAVFAKEKSHGNG